jgi:transcriptional regulator with XRE-family HTH domain
MRQKREMSQQDLAKDLDTSQNAIYRLENPKAHKPNISTLEKIAAFFGVALIVRFAPLSEIVDWTMDMSPASIDVPSFDQDPGFIEKKPAQASMTLNMISAGVTIPPQAQSFKVVPGPVTSNLITMIPPNTKAESMEAMRA